MNKKMTDYLIPDQLFSRMKEIGCNLLKRCIDTAQREPLATYIRYSNLLENTEKCVGPTYYEQKNSVFRSLEHKRCLHCKSLALLRPKHDGQEITILGTNENKKFTIHVTSGDHISLYYNNFIISKYLYKYLIYCEDLHFYPDILFYSKCGNRTYVLEEKCEPLTDIGSFDWISFLDRIFSGIDQGYCFGSISKSDISQNGCIDVTNDAFFVKNDLIFSVGNIASVTSSQFLKEEKNGSTYLDIISFGPYSREYWQDYYAYKLLVSLVTMFPDVEILRTIHNAVIDEFNMPYIGILNNILMEIRSIS